VNRAKQMNDAAEHQLARTEQEIVFRVVDSYYAVLLATKQLEVAEQALKTSQAIMDRSQGEVRTAGWWWSPTCSPRRCRMAARQQETHSGQETIWILARAQLSAAMGVPVDSVFSAG